MKHVISTLAADTKYTGWVHNSGVNTIERSVTVKGGAGVAILGANGQSPGTPMGSRTEISDDDAAWLAEHKQFRDHVKNGFVKIVNKPVDPENVAKEMAKDDGSRQKNSDDVKKDAEEAAKKSGLKPEETLQAVTNKGK